MITSKSVANGFVWVAGAGNISVSTGSSYRFGLKTNGALVEVVSSDFSTDVSDLLITLYEDTSYTGGSELTPVNRNRALARKGLKPPFTIFSGVTPDPLLPQNIVARDGIKTANNATTNQASPSASELVLAPNTHYVLDLSNLSGQGGEVDVSIFFVCEQFEQ